MVSVKKETIFFIHHLNFSKFFQHNPVEVIELRMIRS